MKITLNKEVTSVRYGVTFLANTEYEALKTDGFYFAEHPEIQTKARIRIATTNIKTITHDNE